MFFKKKFPWVEVTAAFVIGVAAGAATALLLTPMTGKKMQKQIKNAVEDQVDNVVDNVEKLVKKVVSA